MSRSAAAAYAPTLNGERTTEYKTDLNDVGNDNWGLTDSRLIGVDAYQSRVIFHSIAIIELGALGKFPR